jgi:exopolysaccharide production protein ExoQ
MISKSKQGDYDLLLLFCILLFSNLTAFVHVIWQIPKLVLIDTILLAVTTLICLWNIKRYQLLPRLKKAFKSYWFIFPFVIFSAISILWSIFIEISIYRWIILTLTIIIGGYIGLRFDLETMIKSLSSFGIWILFLSIVVVIFLPYVGVMNYHIIQGAWKGVFWHKNHMGLIASFVNILFFINIINTFRSHGLSKYGWIFLYLFSLYFIYNTDSVAAYLTTITITIGILITLIWLKFKDKIRKQHIFIFIILLVISALTLFIKHDWFLNIFNRNSTLTGRIPMWTNLFRIYISKRPFLGYGFNAFWYQDTYRITMAQASGYPDPIVISDNGFIDILVNTGFIGLFLFLIFYIGTWWRSIKEAWKATNINGFFPLILMSFTLLANISWSLIFENESFFMLLMITVLFYLSKDETKLAYGTQRLPTHQRGYKTFATSEK